MKRWYRAGFVFCAVGLAALCLAAEPAAITSDEENPNEVRPTGVPHRQHSKSKSAATAKSDSDATSSATPRPRRTHRSTAKSRESEEPIPTQAVPGSVPKTGASSVIVINVSNGQVLYEKNPDQIRAPASTTKLLTGLIVAESGSLDRPVTVAQVDTFAEPVKLNIKPGDIYQRIDLLRALLGARQCRQHRSVCRKDEPARVRARGQEFAFREPERIAGRKAIFDRARPGDDRTGGVCESHNSFDRL